MRAGVVADRLVAQSNRRCATVAELRRSLRDEVAGLARHVSVAYDTFGQRVSLRIKVLSAGGRMVEASQGGPVWSVPVQSPQSLAVIALTGLGEQGLPALVDALARESVTRSAVIGLIGKDMEALSNINLSPIGGILLDQAAVLLSRWPGAEGSSEGVRTSLTQYNPTWQGLSRALSSGTAPADWRLVKFPDVTIFYQPIGGQGNLAVSPSFQLCWPSHGDVAATMTTIFIPVPWIKREFKLVSVEQMMWSSYIRRNLLVD